MEDPQKYTAAWNRVADELSIEQAPGGEEEEIIQLIIQRVRDLIAGDFNLLLSHLYRLDVDEKKVNHILFQQDAVPPDVGIANLIWQRQKERIETKKKYKQPPIEGWDEF